MYSYTCINEYKLRGGRHISITPLLTVSKMGFIILVTCYQVGYWTRHYYICIWQMSQEVEKELHYWEYEHDFFISQSCIKLSKDSLFARSFIKIMLPGGKKLHRLSGGYLLPAWTDNWPCLSDVVVFFFFPHLKRPLACNICVGCYIEEGGEKKRNMLPIAALISELLHFSFSPSSKGSFPPKCLAKQKRCFAFAWKTNHSFTKLRNKC